MAKNPYKSPVVRLSRGASFLLMCGLGTATAGCDNDKPYTPFQVATSLPEDGSAEKPPKEELSESSRAENRPKALRAPAGTQTWTAFGRTLTAPSGTTLHVGLPNSNSESDDVYAWALPAKGKSEGQPGLWQFDEGGRPARLVFRLPDFLPHGEGCRFDASLATTGDFTFTSKVWVTCSEQILAGTPIASLAVLNPQREDPVLLHLRHTKAAVGEKLELDVDSSDRDGDKHDDVEVQVTLVAPSGKREVLPVRWLVRTAGASREPDSPRDEIAKRASRLLIASVRKAERGAAPDEINALRRLLSTLCAELGNPRLFRASGDSLPCGNINESLARLAEAEVQSYLGEDELVRALGAAERADWYGKGVQRADKLAQLLKAKIPASATKRLARFRIRAKSSQAPHRTPLVFDPSGQLWLVTDTTTKRLTMEGDPPLFVPATADEPEKRISPPEWSIEIPGPSGKLLQAAIPSCERSEVLVAFSEGSASAAHAAPVPLPMLAPRPGDCRGFAPAPLPVTPLFWKSNNLAFVVGGEVLTNRGPPHLAEKNIAWPTSIGLAVLKEGKLSLWTGSETKGLHHCAVNGSGSRVACLGDGTVSVLEASSSEKK